MARLSTGDYITQNNFTYQVLSPSSGGGVTLYRIEDKTQVKAETTIPDVIYDSEGNGYNVQEIGYQCFQDVTTLKKINIGNNVKQIRGQAFYCCTSLQEVVFGEALLEIQSQAFTSCPLLSICPNDGLTYIAGQAFYNCNAATLIQLPNSLETIGSGAFGSCSSCETFITPFIGLSRDSGSNIGQMFAVGANATAFYYPENLSKIEVTSAGGSIADQAFTGCGNSLTEVILPGNLTDVGENVFKGCNNITIATVPAIAVSSLPSTVQQLTINGGKSITFEDLQLLTELEYVDIATTTIEDKAFVNCTKLESVSLDSQSYGEGVFEGCNAIRQITLKENAKLAWPNDIHLFDSSGLQSITGEGKNCSTSEGILYNKDKTILWRYPRALQKGKFEIPAHVVRIEQNAFALTSVKYITWPEGMESLILGWHAFYNASNLVSAIFSSSIILDRNIFNNCKNLTTLKFVSGTSFVNAGTTNPDYSYQTCSSLSYVECPAGGLDSIQRAPNITKLTVTNGTIHQDVFLEHENLTTLIIGSGVSTLKTAFRQCNKLTTIIINNPAITISDKPFAECTNIQEVQTPAQVLEYLPKDALQKVVVTTGNIPGASFENCTSLTSVQLTGSQTIGDKAFSGCTSLSTINLRGCNNLTSIGSQAFSNCQSLSICLFPSTNENTVWGNRVFEGCSSLQSITIPLTTASTGVGIFYGCTALTSITAPFIGSSTRTEDNAEAIPDYMNTFKFWFVLDPNESDCTYPSNLTTFILTKDTQLVTGVFSGCSTLQRIQLPNQITNISESAFSGCSALTCVSNNLDRNGERIYLPNLVSIGNYAFKDCSEATSFDFPDSLVNIGKHILVGCNAIQNLKTPFIGASQDEPVRLSEWFMYTDKDNNVIGEYPSSLTDIEITKASKMSDYAFSNFSSLQNIKIDNLEITNLPEGLCSGCASLKSISLPSILTSIEAYAFQECDNLSSIDIPDGVTVIGNNAFDNCGVDTIIIPGSTKSIGEKAFYRATALEYVTMPKTLEVIESQAFASCTTLKQITLTDDEDHSQLKTIGELAFCDCYNLEGISFIGTNTWISSWAFKNCRKLTNVVVPNGVSYSIGIFQGCNGITSITLPIIGITDSKQPHLGEIFGSSKPEAQINYLPNLLNTVRILQDTYVSDKAFYGCSSLCTIELNEGITNIGEKAFYGCTQLGNFSLPSTVTTIGDYAFYDCPTLSSLVFPKNLTSMGQHLIGGCSSLIHLSISNGITNNGIYSSNSECIIKNQEVIYGCYAGTFPTDATIATSIGEYAFEGIEALLILTIPENFTTIKPRAFTGCSKLQEVFIPNSVTSIGANAFENCYSLTAITLPFIGSGYIDSIKLNESTSNQLFGSIFNNATESPIQPQKMYKVAQVYGSQDQTKSFYIPTNLKFVHITKNASQLGGMSGIRTDRIQLSNITVVGKKFFKQNQMNRIDIDNNLQIIEENAFEGCSLLEQITLSPVFKEIKNNAFKDTSKLSQILVYSQDWKAPNVNDNTFYSSTKLYMAKAPKGTNSLPRNSYVARITGDRDFLGFWFNGLHSIDDLGVYRTGDGMHNNSLSAKTESTEVNIPGSNGMYYFGAYDRSRTFSVDFAFDHMTEKQLRVWKNLCSSKDLGELVFDEAPYKVYTAKITGTPKLQYIPFIEDGERIYKGKGTIEFTCYYPYAHTPNPDTKMFKSLWTPINKNADAPDFAVRGTCLDAYFDASFPTKHEWAESTHIPKEPTIGVNPGDMPAPFLLTTLASVHNGTELQVGDAKITIKQDTTKPVHWDSRSGLVYTFDEKGGKKPIYYSGNSIATIPVTDEPIEWSSIADLEYDYWYY